MRATAGWQAAVSRTNGHQYYVETATGRSQWHFPVADGAGPPQKSAPTNTGKRPNSTNSSDKKETLELMKQLYEQGVGVKDPP